MTPAWRFDNTYARLPSFFFARVEPTPSSAPRLVALNESLARDLGLDPAALASPEGVDVLAGRAVPEGAEPLAMAYAGHQFGQFVPQLGDGRAILLGEVTDVRGHRYDIQLKGAGRTPFSRGGDGKAALGPVLREFLISEAMHALGIPTTRSLAAVTTGDRVMREAILPGAVLTRVALSHVRVGTFQFFAARGNVEGLRQLADYAIARLDPDLADRPGRYRAFLDRVVARQAALVARWLLVGFIHGVMNTDNMALSGETIDYGPCAFMEAYDPRMVFSSIDQFGRYAYANQPTIAHWNLARLAECFIPLLGDSKEAGLDEAKAAIERFPELFQAAYGEGAAAKLGLASPRPDDLQLMQDLLDLMAAHGADFTLTFRRLCDAAEDPARDGWVRSALGGSDLFDGWDRRWRERLADDAASPAERAARMRRANPLFIPRNHRVEEALGAAVEEGNLAPFHSLRAVLQRPFEDQPEHAAYAEPAPDGGRDYVTFCGT
ncbi:MAG: YdiU family protein [Alsobacter sp.]